ncbi:DnaD domain protein [Anaerosalibacter bizertensis]|uniref:DnaD domain protein n=1 Tax=Anaerosalibacter bizertensis TaxID=932217 RepID=UPI0018A6B970|nr:DnaD domain protein [Anaerosalibacter bizertensis]
MSGWISIHRKIQDHWLWQEKPFDKRSAWIDLLLMANHKDNKFLLGNELIEVKRGSFITSEYKLMDRWGWSKTKVRNFLKLLEDDKMIIKISDRKKTTLTIVNYNDYQISETTKEPLKDYGETTKEPHKNPNNNDNNDNNSLCMYDENFKNIIRLLEKNTGVIPPILIDEIYEYSNVFNLDMFSEATKIAANNKKRTVNYILGILRNWKDNNILTIDDLEALRREKEIERQQKQQNQQYKNKQYNQPKKTKFHNFEQRTDKYSADQLDDIAERKMLEHLERLRNQNAL